ncbi:MAG: hypothetical protein KDD12_19090 [Lewinella sp.]|nr:hypothetical protein [Lewinella sp.]
MLKHSVINILSGFDRKEMTRFKAFAWSPYFNKHDEVRNLIDYFNGIYPHFTEQTCNRHIIFPHVFPGAPHDQARLAVVFSYTRKLAEQFLIQEAFKEETQPARVMLLGQLRKRKLFDQYESLLERTEKELEESAWRDGAHFQRMHAVAAEADHFFTHAKKEERLGSLEQKQRSLDVYYLSTKLKDAVEMQIRRNLRQFDYSSRLLEHVLKEVEHNMDLYAATPTILLYYQLYRMFSDTAHQFYYEARATLVRAKPFLPEPELASIYNYFQNYCIREINRNQEPFLDELFGLYQIQLEQDLLLEDGFLPEWHYKNITTTAIRLSKLEWIKNFLEQFRDKLRPEVAENAYCFNMAAYFHACESYDKVLELLNQVTYSDIRYSLGARALLLRTYYELEEDEALFSLVDSFRQFLQRHKLLADSRRNGYDHLFRFTRKAAQLRAALGYSSAKKAKQELLRLEQEIDMAPSVFNKSWLQQKIRDLIESRL